MHRVGFVGVAIDHAAAGVDRGSSLRIDHRDLPCVAARVFVGDALDHFVDWKTLFEQRDGFRPILPVRRRLRRHGADAWFRMRNRRPRAKRAGLHSNAQFVGCGIERDDREGAEPRIGCRGQFRRYGLLSCGRRNQHSQQNQDERSHGRESNPRAHPLPDLPDVPNLPVPP
jgi:hypothetical protein